MKNKKNSVSIMISKALLVACFALLLSTLFIIPFIGSWYDEVTGEKLALQLTVVLYICAFICMVIVISLFTVLKNLDKGKIFVKKNADLLGNISLCLFGIAVILAVFGIIWKLFAIAFAFLFVLLGMIIRTLYHVFSEAVSMKDEQDYTI